MRLVSAFAALACVAAAAAQEPDPKPALRLPPAVKVQQGKLARIACETAAKKVTWRIPPAVDADYRDDGKRLVCSAMPGQYTLQAFVPDADGGVAFAETVLTVESPAPPAPEDTFRKDLLALAAADPDADRVMNLKKLASLYRAASTFAVNKDVPTAAVLVDKIRGAAATLLPDTALTATRKRVLEELQRVLPIDGDAPLTDDQRRRAADIYTRAGSALEEAAK